MQAIRNELEIKDGMVKSLLKAIKDDDEGRLSDLRNSVMDHLTLVNSLIKEEEEKLIVKNTNKNSCIDEIENCFQWLKATINLFPDAAKETIEESLSISQNVVALIDEKEDWITSLIEKTISIARGLPYEENEMLLGKAQELKNCFEEIKKQAQDHVKDLMAKTHEKRKVKNLLFIIISKTIYNFIDILIVNLMKIETPFLVFNGVL